MLPRRSIFYGYQTFSAKIRDYIEILDNGRNLGKIYHRAIENIVSGRVRLRRNIRRNKCQIWIYFGKSSRINLPKETQRLFLWKNTRWIFSGDEWMEHFASVRCYLQRRYSIRYRGLSNLFIIYLSTKVIDWGPMYRNSLGKFILYYFRASYRGISSIVN